MGNANRMALINSVWQLVIDHGLSHREVARRLGLTEARVDRIVAAVHQRRMLGQKYRPTPQHRQ